MIKNAAYVKVILPDDVIDEDSPKFSLRAKNGKDLEFTINIKTAKILEWNEKFGSDYLFCKAVDSGTYILLDENKNEISRIEGYVPNKLIPEHDGYGDYIDMNISTHGYVINWYNNPSFEDFN